MLTTLIDGMFGFLLYASAFLLVLTVVVFVHELGHFLVARWCGVQVAVFSIGFGKELFGFFDRYGTRWRFACIPLGGYVKFIDDTNPASVPTSGGSETSSASMDGGAFHTKTVWQRAAVVAAGPIANFILAILIFAAMFLVFGQFKMEPRVASVVAGLPAEKAGIEPGDLIRSIDGRDIDDFGQLQETIATNPGAPVKVVVERNDQLLTLTMTPIIREMTNRVAGKHKRAVIGIQATREMSKTSHTSVGAVQALYLGVERTYSIIRQTLSFLAQIVRFERSGDEIRSIISIADASGKVAQLGPEYIIQFIAFISVSIGLINLFPIPLLDGGHLLYYAIEAIRGRPLSAQAQEVGFKIGLAMVISLMLFATWNDRLVLKGWFDTLTVQKRAE
ncbi:MAG: RIP metalloprotease RseP [Hyphomicrobiaceae bacterium]